jgi:hypothetical protein
MKRIGLWTFLAVSALALTSGCAGPAASTSAPAADQPYAPVIDPADFVMPIDNPYFPLKPGTTFVYEGETEKGREHNEVKVTMETKVILGVTCVVVWDTVTVDGKLEEATYDWYAQDQQGNVWYFGEDSKEYDENGNVTSTQGSWEAGVDGAQPGIIMQAAPKVGDIYRQEYYEGEAEDMAEVVSLKEAVTVPYGAYTDVLMTKEWSALEPAVVEQKYYAAGIGLILVTAGDGSRLELVEIRPE